jgi:hypothetical protein
VAELGVGSAAGSAQRGCRVVAGIFNCRREEGKFQRDGGAARVANLCFGVLRICKH